MRKLIIRLSGSPEVVNLTLIHVKLLNSHACLREVVHSCTSFMMSFKGTPPPLTQQQQEQQQQQQQQQEQQQHRMSDAASSGR